MARPLAVKVLHIGSSMPDDWGGIERYVAYLSTAQACAGLDVTVACVPGSPLAERLEVRQVPVRLRHKFDLRALASYLRLFRAESFDLVVTHFSPDYLVPAWASWLAGGPKMALTRHVAVLLRPTRAAEYRRLYSGFVAVSKAVSDVLAETGIEAEVAHPGIPDPGEQPFPDGPATACVVGRLVEEKGQRVAVQSAFGSTWRWRFVGSGPDEARLRAEAPPNATMVGAVADPLSEMAQAHAVVVPSVWVEAFGLVAVEAMATGRCVVASAKGGLTEIVTPGETGLLVPAGDADALRQALETLDTATAEEMGHAGRQRYCAEFTLEAMERRTSGAYRRILARQAVK